MTAAGTFTRLEIQSQPKAWQSTLVKLQADHSSLTALYAQGQFGAVVFTGCGSTYYLALAAAALFQQMTNIPARGLPASEVWLNPASSYRPNERTLLVAISRSGETTETLHAVENFQQHGTGEVLTLSCYPDKALATAGTHNVVLEAGQEDSVAQTRAWSVLYLGVIALCLAASNDKHSWETLSTLPAAGAHILQSYAALAEEIGRSTYLDRFYFLGSGGRYGIASELSLKMKEMSLTHSEPFHFMEFRHGPMSMVTPGTLIFALLSDSQRIHEFAVVQEMRALGARVIILAETDADIAFASGVREPLRNVLYLPFGQMMAFERALSKGLNPDRPTNLETVVRLTNGVSAG
jgi:glucosamine--fructose-6-phosphate aminotransferase (isomerizing)